MHKIGLGVEPDGPTCEIMMELDPALSPDNYILDFLNHQACYEAEVAWMIMRGLRPGDTVFDVGANIGFFTLFMSKLVGPEGKVLAFEPGPNNLTALNHNLGLNECKNVHVITAPVWNRVEEISFYLNSDSRASNCVFDPGEWHENVKSKANKIVLPMMATTLDVYAHHKPRMIKVDVEGAEHDVLKGANALLAIHRPSFIICELNRFGLSQAGSTAEKLRAMMKNYGYDLFMLRRSGHIPPMIPPNSAIEYTGGWRVMNVLFSTLEAVGEAWSKVEQT